MGVSRSGSLAALTAAAVLSLATSNSGEPQRGGAAGAVGSIRGRVASAAARALGPLKVVVDEKVCGVSVPNDAIVVDPEGGVAFAVVAVKGLAWGAAAPARLSNKGCRFVPHVSVIRSGTTVEVTNEDDTLHTTHIYASDGRSLFNIALPLAGLTVKRPVDAPSGAARVACDTHPWMQGFVYVTPDRAAVSGLDGRFVLADIPAGSYELTIWHERLKGSAQRVTVAAGQAVDVDFMMTPGP